MEKSEVSAREPDGWISCKLECAIQGRTSTVSHTNHHSLWSELPARFWGD